ncbi:Clavaminate synthase-like protein [Basidiobolus meristosporus CBS 931.73]|uniref:Clavaminate synthase-like protein n=1 Tax=Basidiobolus meristosporus CBS 931.73 TaxID=1314790 RepID=A0A1Y1ZCB6_9FUNG|nr:Clavaminate synthase-like protein [Basidiobolus meristosporus CBS 931.73]|eukprot:ORY07607.1 Clavaminate synthase-like protein [Basidiobolus meristosporus CBS 931.73]
MSSQSLPLPVLDFSKFKSNPAVFIDQIKEALCSTGFFYLKNHDVPKEAIQQLFQRSKEFFQLELEVKSEMPITPSNEGYTGPGVEILDPKLGLDSKEAFNFKFNPQAGPPKLPAALAKQEDELVEFYKTCHSQCLEILRALAMTLEIPEKEGGANHFTDKHDINQKSGSVLRMLHYFPLTEAVNEDIRAGAHTDYGSLTLLFQNGISGLQILNRAAKGESDEWLDAPCLEDAIIVNIGDLMQFWTNGLFKSTKHRVVFHPEQKQSSRYSIAFFCHPNDSVSLDPISSPLIVNIHEKPQINAAMHLEQRLQATYGNYEKAI